MVDEKKEVCTSTKRRKGVKNEESEKIVIGR